MGRQSLSTDDCGLRIMSNRQPQIRATAMPTDLNPYGGVFGGWLMAQMALGSGSLASREGKGKAVVVSATDFAFPGACRWATTVGLLRDRRHRHHLAHHHRRGDRPRTQWRGRDQGRARHLQIRPAGRQRPPPRGGGAMGLTGMSQPLSPTPLQRGERGFERCPTGPGPCDTQPHEPHPFSAPERHNSRSRATRIFFACTV